MKISPISKAYDWVKSLASRLPPDRGDPGAHGLGRQLDLHIRGTRRFRSTCCGPTCGSLSVTFLAAEFFEVRGGNQYRTIYNLHVPLNFKNFRNMKYLQISNGIWRWPFRDNCVTKKCIRFQQSKPVAQVTAVTTSPWSSSSIHFLPLVKSNLESRAWQEKNKRVYILEL